MTNKMDTTEMSINDRSQKLLDELYNNNYDDNKEQNFTRISEILAEFRVLTREKTLKPELLDGRCTKTLVKYSSECHIEAQKCLSNLILNYGHLRELLVEPYVDCVEKRLESILSDDFKDKKPDQIIGDRQTGELLYYDLRIIFLLSALCPASRAKIRDRLAEMILQMTCKEADNFQQENYLLVIESLKTSFNLTLDKCINENLAATVIKKLFAIVGTENDLIHETSDGTKLDVTDQLLVNLIHLLTNMPKQVYLKLSDEDVNKILNYLDTQLRNYSKNNVRETVLPVLNVCANICKYNESIRQRWFDDIIGSTKEFEKRPEEYDNLRGRLVKLMTSVDVHIKDIAAEFLHALCGGDTEKFITYTGFGNSAAFLSSRGLLTQGYRRPSQGQDGQSRLESDKDYTTLRDRLDPITGKIETVKRNPMEGMTEEEKERHADELVGAISKLANLGVIKPMAVDGQGRLSELNCREDFTNGEPKQEDGDSD